MEVIMKFGPRKPSLKRSIKARTTGKLKRRAKKAVNPFYGKKGMGWIRNPRKAAYNKIYNKTTFSVFKMPTTGGRKKSSNKPKVSTKENSYDKNTFTYMETETIHNKKIKKPAAVFFVICLAIVGFTIGSYPGLFIGILLSVLEIKYNNNKPETEVKEVRKRLSSSEIKELEKDVVAYLNTYNKSINTLDSTTNVDLFFEKLKSAEDNINKAVELIVKYNLPDSDNEITKLPTLLEEHKTGIILNFIQNYYNKERESADKLKTEKGRLNRMRARKDSLLAYEDMIPKEGIDRINELWAD